MAKRLKLKLSRVIPSLQLCRSKRFANSAQTPAPAAIYRLSPVNRKALDISFPNNNLPAQPPPPSPSPSPSTPEDRFTKGHVLSKVISVECDCRSGSCTLDLSDDFSFKYPDCAWKREATEGHVVSKFHASNDGDLSPIWVNKGKTKSQRKNKEKKTIMASVNSSRDTGCFSGEEDESKETDGLIACSRDYSSCELDRSHSLLEGTLADSCHNRENISRMKQVNTNTKKIRSLRRHASKNFKEPNTTVLSPEMESRSKASVLRRMLPWTVEGKVKESVAVAKKSVDPYEDFKRSMLEMILEKQLFEAKDLQELLQCFLYLNSRQYHGIIVEAFSEIWGLLFGDFPVKAQPAITIKV